MTRRQMVVVGGLVTFYLLGLGTLVGIVALEPDARTPSDLAAATASPLEAVDRALRLGDIVDAERAWRTAYVAAARSRSWRALADLGDAALRIGDAAGQRGSYVARAREAYLAALVRARADRSREGVTRMRHAFRMLGDHELAQQCAIIAEQLPARDVDTTPVRDRSTSAGGTHGSIRDR
jgi:hypothetical protein